MMAPPRLHQLRLALERLAVAHLRAHHFAPPPMIAFLAIPLPERLVLLALYDGEKPSVIRQLLKVSDEDVALESKRMREAVKLLSAAMDEPWNFIPEGDHDTQLAQIVFPYYPGILIGECVPTCLAKLSLKQRLAVYLVLVERLNYRGHEPQVQAYLRCSEHFVKQAIKDAQQSIGGK